MANKSCKKLQKVANQFYCEICDYSTSRRSSYDKHLSTDKHKMLILANNANEKVAKVAKNPTEHSCICGKTYTHLSSLCKHKKTCKNAITQSQDEFKITDKLFYEIIKQNNELQTKILDMTEKTMANNSYNNNNTNSHNKTFNLQVFLNETCKDAMNIMDFVNSMEIELADLEKVGELGYVDGMTNIILKNLKALDVTKRPLHCTDAKREIMYIKDDNKWEKETENKDKMKKALKYIMHKNAKMLNVFKEKYPDCIKSYSNRCDQYNKLVIEVLGGRGDNEPQHNEKIIRRIAKNVTIDKKLMTE